MSSPSTLVQPVPRRADRRLDTAWLGGVCSGLAAHLNWPVLVLRLGFVLLSASMGIGVLVYLVLWLAMPLASEAPQAPGIEAASRSGMRTVQAGYRVPADLGLISADGLRSLARLLRGVRVNPQLRRQVAMGRIPRWVRPPGAGVLRLLGQSQLADLLHWSGPRSADAYWQATADADDYKKFFWRKLSDAFGGGPVHAVLTPPHATPALRHGTALHLLLGGSYCFLANLLDAPAGVLPAGSISDEDQQQELSQRRDWWELEQHYAKQNATGSAGLPVGVQVMSPPWRDELVFAVMAALEGRSELRPAAGAP